MKLFELGDIDWKDTQLVYHALAYEGIEALVLSFPQGKGMCLGLHQHPKDELDLDYCGANGIGIFRREIGGGAVFITDNQVFYNVIVRRDREGVPRIPEAFFKKYLEPVLGALSDLDVIGQYRPLCDILVNDRKISGNGGGEVGDCMVVTGDLLLDFDFGTMANAMNLPQEMKAVFLEKLRENLTTLGIELDFAPSKDEVSRALVVSYEKLLGPLEASKLDTRILGKMKELKKRFSSDEWLHQRGARKLGQEVKVREGVYLFRKEFKTSSGPLTVSLETSDNSIIRVDVTGFEEVTRRRVADALLGLKYDKVALEEVVLDCMGG